MSTYNTCFYGEIRKKISQNYDQLFIFNKSLVYYFVGMNKTNAELHNPDDRILQRQFVNNLIVLAYHLYHKEHP